MRLHALAPTLLTVLLGCATAPLVLATALPDQDAGVGEKVVQSASGALSAVVPDKNWKIVERLPYTLKIEPSGTPMALAASADFIAEDDDGLSLEDLVKQTVGRELTARIPWRVTEQGPALLGGRRAVRLQAQAMIDQTAILLLTVGRREGRRLCLLQLTSMPALLGLGMPIFERASDTFRCTPPPDDDPGRKTSAAALVRLAEQSIEGLDPSRAVALLGRAAARDPGNETIIEKLVQAALVLGDAPRAQRALKSELVRAPERFEHWKLLAQIQYQQGDAEGGLATLKTAAARPGAPASLYVALGEGFLHAEAYGDAEAAFQQAIAKDPKDATARAALGDAYFHEKRYPDAEKALDQAIALDPARAEYHVALSEVYGELSSLQGTGTASAQLDQRAADECIAALERGVPKPLEATLKYNLACFNARLGRQRECLFWLRQAFEAGFNDVEFMRKDPDLASVRDLPAFQELFRR